MYLVIHNSVMLSKILKIVVPFWLLFSMLIIIKIINFIESKIEFSKFHSYGTTIFNILDNTTELWMTKYIIGVIFSSGGATLYKNPSDQTLHVSTSCRKLMYSLHFVRNRTFITIQFSTIHFNTLLEISNKQY